MLKREDAEGNVMKAIPSYYDTKIEKRKNIKIEQAKELRALFEKALVFYNDHYPKSFQTKHGFKWDIKKQKLSLLDKKIFFEELKELSIEDKLLARYILFYSLKERNYKKIDTFNKYNELRGHLRKLIPGGKLLSKIEKLEEEQQKKGKILKDLKAQYIKEVEDATKNSVKPSTKVKCKLCEKECNSPAGLASHMRNAHKPKEPNKPKTLIQHTDGLTLP